MVMMEIYSIWDRKLSQYGQLLLSQNVLAMSRELQSVLVGSKSMMDQYPEDFELHRIGLFDTTTGVLEVKARPEVVVSLVNILRNEGNGAAR